MEEAFSGDFENKLGKENKKPTCYCVWNNALGTGIMTIILLPNDFLRSVTLRRGVSLESDKE